MSSLRTAFSITINVIAAVSVILVNKKAVFDIAKFHFGVLVRPSHTTRASARAHAHTRACMHGHVG